MLINGTAYRNVDSGLKMLIEHIKHWLVLQKSSEQNHEIFYLDLLAPPPVVAILRTYDPNKPSKFKDVYGVTAEKNIATFFFTSDWNVWKVFEATTMRKNQPLAAFLEKLTKN